ncbi:MAG: peroxidase family protein [Pseudomonadota bacterium]
MYCQTHHGSWIGRGVYRRANDGLPFLAYLFPDAAVPPSSDGRLAALDALGTAMIAQAPDPAEGSTTPPVFTFLGQFIDHDIAAVADLGPQANGVEDAAPRDRARVERDLVNFRDGRLDLGSLYGGGMAAFATDEADRAFLAKMKDLLRFPEDPSRMWVAFYDGEAEGRPGDPRAVVDLPADRAGDLLRLGRLLEGPNPLVTQAELAALSPELGKTFLRDGTPMTARAVLGDLRNDDNLALAQLHLAFLRLHNGVAEARKAQRRHDGLPHDPEVVFTWAQRRVRWIYQWLVVNVFLPRICDPERLAHVIASEAEVYRDFLARLGWAGGPLPLPLEFAAAAFRYSHATVRASYDWNPFFGRAADGKDNRLPEAPLRELDRLTGNGGLGGRDRLPGHWGADWARMIGAPGGHDGWMARRIGPRLALPLGRLDGSDDPNLARRHLRLGHRLNLPSAQDCIAALRRYDADLPTLPEARLGQGAAGLALEAGGMIGATPLWYYVLREAEALERGERLGPLGTHLVAGTLLGLIVSDEASYWNQMGSDRGRWCPSDLGVDGLPALDDLAPILEFAGLYIRRD